MILFCNYLAEVIDNSLLLVQGLLFDTTEKYNEARMHSLSGRWKAEYGEMFNFSNMRGMRGIVQAWACLDATTEGMKLFRPL